MAVSPGIGQELKKIQKDTQIVTEKDAEMEMVHKDSQHFSGLLHLQS